MENIPAQNVFYYRACKRSADMNEFFMFLVNDGLTKKELQKLINKRPEVWQRFSNWLDKLP
jgi:hypothetical protein